MLGFEYVSFVNALEICDLDFLSPRRETHCLNFARSLLKSERTKMLIPPADRRFMANSLEIAPTSPNYVRALTDSLKAPYPTTLACLIPPSLPSWWLLRCSFPFGVVIGFLFCLPLLIFCCLYVVLFLCLFVWRYSALGLRCYANKIIPYHIKTLHFMTNIGPNYTLMNYCVPKNSNMFIPYSYTSSSPKLLFAMKLWIKLTVLHL